MSDIPTSGGILCPVSINQGDTTICDGVQLTLSVNGIYLTYDWAPSNETTNSIVVSPSSQTTYTVTVFDGISTCSSTVTIDVSPVYSSQEQASVCQGILIYCPTEIR
ncbi:MAG: hypothetical protein IPQ03_15615 [Bacteroidetes bacterium]|nr:hypothetical protein [Bacteroidota bacterium]